MRGRWIRAPAAAIAIMLLVGCGSDNGTTAPEGSGEEGLPAISDLRAVPGQQGPYACYYYLQWTAPDSAAAYEARFVAGYPWELPTEADSIWAVGEIIDEDSDCYEDWPPIPHPGGYNEQAEIRTCWHPSYEGRFVLRYWWGDWSPCSNVVAIPGCPPPF